MGDWFKIWNDIEENIRSSDSEMKKFIRYFWLSKYSFQTEKKLYKTIKEKITDYNRFLKDLLIASEWYSHILNPAINDFNGLRVNNRDIGNKIYNISFASKVLGVIQGNVFYLSLIRNVENGKLKIDPKKILLTLEKFLFKYFDICSQPANKVERMFSKYSIELEKVCGETNLSDEKLKRKTKILFESFTTELNELIPLKELFIEKFNEIKYSTSQKSRFLIKYIFDKYEIFLSNTNERNLNFERINIEHLLPQDPTRWGLTKYEVKTYVNNIGNLVLIDTRLNGRMGNKPLIDKIPTLEESELKINKEILELIEETNNKWNKNTIHKRNNELAIKFYEEVFN